MVMSNVSLNVSQKSSVRRQRSEQEMASRSLFRAQVHSQRVSHPFAEYDTAQRLTCKLCRIIVASEAVWSAHLVSVAHKQTVDRLRSKTSNSVNTGSGEAASAPSGLSVASSSSAAASGMPLSRATASQAAQLPASATTTAGGSAHAQDGGAAAIPTGFFDDQEADAKARGVDLAAERAAAESDALSSFLGSVTGPTGEVAAAAREAEEEEGRAAEERARTAQAEHALYKARLALWKEGIDPRLQVEEPASTGAAASSSSASGGGASGAASSARAPPADEPPAGLLVQELLEPVNSALGSKSILAAGRSEQLSTAMAKRRRLMAGVAADDSSQVKATGQGDQGADSDSDGELTALLDWRRKGR